MLLFDMAGVLRACAGSSSGSQTMDMVASLEFSGLVLDRPQVHRQSISRILIPISPGLDRFPNHFPWDLDVLRPKMGKGCHSLPGFVSVRFSQ